MPSLLATGTHATGGWTGFNRQGGRENDVEQTYRDAIRTGDLNAWTQLADWLGRQPGREAEAEQVYRDAVAAGDPNARARPPSGADASAALWAEFVKARDAGLTRYIGVSNYSPAQIDLLVRTGGEAPVLNQIPFGPNDWDADLVAAHVERGVVVEGYSGFKRSDLRAPALVAAAQAHGVTVPQVVVRWHVQHDVVVIPKSMTPDRIAANIDVDGFALSADEMAAIDALGS